MKTDSQKFTARGQRIRCMYTLAEVKSTPGKEQRHDSSKRKRVDFTSSNGLGASQDGDPTHYLKVKVTYTIAKALQDLIISLG